LIEGKVEATALAESINLNFKRQVQEWKNVLLRGHEQSDREKYWRQFGELQTKIQTDVARFISMPVDARFTAQMRDFQQQHQALMSEYEHGYQAFIEAGYSHMTGDQAVRGIDREPTKLLESLAKQMSQDTTQESEVISQAGSTSVRIAVILAIVVSAVVASLFMNRKRMGDAIDKLQGTQH
jgi:methyl-accepting chemotaxis protein